MMKYSVVFERVRDAGFPPGYYYAHIPSLDLTTHGEGIDGAKKAALELIHGWIEEKRANGDPIPVEEDAFFSQLEIADAV